MPLRQCSKLILECKLPVVFGLVGDVLHQSLDLRLTHTEGPATGLPISSRIIMRMRGCQCLQDLAIGLR